MKTPKSVWYVFALMLTIMAIVMSFGVVAIIIQLFLSGWVGIIIFLLCLIIISILLGNYLERTDI